MSEGKQNWGIGCYRTSGARDWLLKVPPHCSLTASKTWG